MFRVFRDQDDKGGDPSQGVKLEKSGWTSAVSDKIFDVHGEELLKHENINSVLDDYYGQKEKLSKAILKPEENASEEEINKFKESMNIPLKVEEYELGEIPEGATKDENFDKWIKDQALQLGLTKNQVKDLHKGWKILEATGYKSQAEESKKAKSDTEKAMKLKFGDNYEAAMGKVKVILELGGTEFVSRLKETGLDNDPGMVMALAKLGVLISEDSLKIPKGDKPKTKLSAAEVLYGGHGK